MEKYASIQAAMIAESSTSGSVEQEERKPLGPAWTLETSKPTTVTYFLQQDHLYSNKATPSILPTLCHSLITEHSNI